MSFVNVKELRSSIDPSVLMEVFYSIVHKNKLLLLLKFLLANLLFMRTYYKNYPPKLCVFGLKLIKKITK